MVNQFATRVLRPFNGEKAVFPKNGIGTKGYPQPKNEAESLSHTI